MNPRTRPDAQITSPNAWLGSHLSIGSRARAERHAGIGCANEAAVKRDAEERQGRS